MIRIDEIYNAVFWPHIQNHLPLTRMFFCDPFGCVAPENLCNFGHDVNEKNFVYLHDQEPIYTDLHRTVFSSLHQRNIDLELPMHRAIVTSERQSDSLTQVCKEYNLRPYYYFFHGWAALDWYRGYNRNLSLLPCQQRRPTKVFFNANRIISGRRIHRIVLMYLLAKKQCLDGYYSLPARCPESGQHIMDLALPLSNRYADINEILSQMSLPKNLPGENGHPMESFQLSQFEPAADSLVYIVTETVAQNRRLHLTEKIFRPICLQMPFILASTRGSLAYLKSYGFQTFDQFWDESYDDEQDDFRRLEFISEIVEKLHGLTIMQRQKLFQDMIPIIQHNHAHFYSGEFESILWKELIGMLDTITHDFAI